jgi:hypothetical protein
MKLIGILVSALLTFFLFGAGSAVCKGQDLSVETYDQVIETLMPMSSDLRGFDFSYVIRAKPAFEPEFLLRIVVKDRWVEITQVIPKKGNIFNYLTELTARTGNQWDVNGLTKAVELVRQTKRLPLGRFKELHNDFRRNLFSLTRGQRDQSKGPSATGRSAEVIVDGTTYEVRYEAPTGEYITTRSYDYSLDSKKFNSGIVRWIKRVHEYTFKIAKE